PEYESAVMLGSDIMIGDTNTIIAANYLCDEYGIDTISVGNVIAFAMECYEKGFLKDSDTGGLPLTWGNDETVLTLIELIGKKEGFGKRLSQGVARLSKEIPGSESFAMHVKGLELAAYDPRGVFGQALSYAIAPRGGEHGRGGYMIVEFFMPEVDLYTHEGKAAKAIQMAEDATLYDLACVCSFNFIPAPSLHPLITAVVGKEYTEESIREVTRRVITLERKFNIREGFTRKDDTLPPRLLNEPLPDGMAEGKKIDCLDLMLDDYYKLMGWNKEGNPPDEA
ncbi:MAG: aldehyde ferredoxin oxidoreductase C-terminal domain-containing protein, partial [Deltaproteobacteria bacterium]|nr:aldehyde ferredoxin oxidoreductase C-terminal domain-containing protein [Deltaproteobacteria bacterium]